MSLSIKEPFPNRYLYCPNGCVLCFGGGRFCRGVDPTHPPPPLIEPPDPRVYKHCSTPAIRIFQNHDSNSQTQTPHPLKILKNSQGTMSNVGQHQIKNAPTLRAGAKDGNSKPSRRSNDLRHHRKEVYTNTNEATSATPALTLRNARTFDLRRVSSRGGRRHRGSPVF